MSFMKCGRDRAALLALLLTECALCTYISAILHAELQKHSLENRYLTSWFCTLYLTTPKRVVCEIHNSSAIALGLPRLLEARRLS